MVDTKPTKAKNFTEHIILNTTEAVKDDIVQFLNDHYQWYKENLLRDHAETILKECNSGPLDECLISDDDGFILPLEIFIEELYELIMINIYNVIETTEIRKEVEK